MLIDYLTIAVPKNVIDRSSLDQEQLANFERVTGIKKTRRFEGTTTQMIIQALDACGFSSDNEIDNVIVVTQSPDRLSPCTAMEVHNHLKLPPIALAFDINRACDGWILGLDVCSRLPGKTLLICADRLRYAPNPIEGLIFSDSVSITVVKEHETPPKFSYNDGSKSDRLYCSVDGEMKMDGGFVFDFVTTKMPDMIKLFNEKYPCDLLVPHQANLSMLKILAMRTGFKDKWLSSIEEYGNQSMNSVPMAILANEEKAVDKQLLLCGFGAGMGVSLMKLRWPKEMGLVVTI